jgi:hypothetical protein
MRTTIRSRPERVCDVPSRILTIIPSFYPTPDVIPGARSSGGNVMAPASSVPAGANEVGHP